MAKLGFGFVRKKINDWENQQLQSKLKIIDEKRITIDGLADKAPYMLIGLHLDSKIPMKLCPEEIMGKLEARGYRDDFSWHRRAKTVSDHVIEDIVAYGDSWWGFRMQPSLATLKDNINSRWTIHFTVIFQHQLSKTFKDIKFKIRDSDAKRIQTFQEVT